MLHQLQCPRCHRGMFSATLTSSAIDPHDPRTYIQLSCETCQIPSPLLFVVDLTPEFEHNSALYNAETGVPKI